MANPQKVMNKALGALEATCHSHKDMIRWESSVLKNAFVQIWKEKNNFKEAVISLLEVYKIDKNLLNSFYKRVELNRDQKFPL